MTSAQDKQEALQVAALKEIRATNWAYLAELHKHHAKTLKLRYESYIQAGFNEATALYFIVNGVH